jgi:hypothetical protein
MNSLKNRTFPACDFNFFQIGGIHLATIQSLVIIAITAMYYWNNGIQTGVLTFTPQTKEILSILAPLVGYVCFMLIAKAKPRTWHFLLLASAILLTHNVHVNAQILDDVEGAIEEVGTAAGGNIAAEILTAIIQIARVAFYFAIAGAVIASVIFGVVQGQWQAPVLVLGVIGAVGLFLELMGVAVFG